MILPTIVANQGAQAKATQALADATRASGGGDLSTPLKWGVGGAALLGGGALLNSMRQTKALEEQASAADRGKIRVTLPTRTPGDQKTQIELPYEQLNLSDSLHHAIARDTRRRLRAESASRVMHRGRPALDDQDTTPAAA